MRGPIPRHRPALPLDPRARARTRRRPWLPPLAAAASIGSGLVSPAWAASPPPHPTAPPPPSAIGNEAVQELAVSPAYVHSGLVLAAATTTLGCSSDCTHLWRSVDGGSHWQRAGANGWKAGA